MSALSTASTHLLWEAAECVYQEEPDEDHPSLSWCSECKAVYCEDCWRVQPLHRRRKPTAEQHEKTELGVAKLIHDILRPEEDLVNQTERHIENISTKWFGVTADESGKRMLQDFKRFDDLAFSKETAARKQYPCIVTFVGATGAGKSTLINALMKLKHSSEVTPVVGANLHIPTSGDVHLFPDPETYRSKRPIYYADCEGLQGGNRKPMESDIQDGSAVQPYHYPQTSRSSTPMQRLRGVLSSAALPSGSEPSRKTKNNTPAIYESRQTQVAPAVWSSPMQQRKMMYAQRSQQYEIKWADGKVTRENLVATLYPRVLFTFSDIVVFVSKELRTLENHIQTLIDWAEGAFEQSVNQPTLPHVVVAVNALENQNNTTHSLNWWDTDIATAKVLGDLSAAIHEPGSLRRLAEQWKERGKAINSLGDLLSCYFSSVKIVCIPRSNRPPHLIYTQYDSLYREIKQAAWDSRKRREQSGMLFSSSELQQYLRASFEHFCTHANRPFNFLRAAARKNRVGKTFEDHIIEAATLFMEKEPHLEGEQLSVELSRLVASSMLLNATRLLLPGRFHMESVFLRYKKICAKTLTHFYNNHWRCEKRDKRGNRCVNVAVCHDKGHQDETGKVFEKGEYISSFHTNEVQQRRDFLVKLKYRLSKFLDLKRKTYIPEGLDEDEEKVVAMLHRDHTLRSYTHIWGTGATGSHTTCFSCLYCVPMHILYCGHIICDRCFVNYSEAINGGRREITVCPLCCNVDYPWPTPWIIASKPATAGLRILTLDGGGMRSVVQLAILAQLERCIDLGIPIRQFFDLIIGTSGGGIVAFGVGIRQVEIEECLEDFKTLAAKAFTKRVLTGTPILGTLIEGYFHSRYRTGSLEKALKSIFGQEPLFGAQASSSQAFPVATRVGVTTCVESDQTAFLLANYNRVRTDCDVAGTPCKFLRAANRDKEVKTWEALRATTAAPTFFRPFYHKSSSLSFIDGAIKFNNPAELANEERKMLWPESKNRDPDILLSIGTAFDSSVPPPPVVPKADQRGISLFVKRMLKFVNTVIEDSTNGQRAWKSFIGKLAIERGDQDKQRKYVRLNPDLAETGIGLPKFDEVEKMDQLFEHVNTSYLPSISAELQVVANTLVASLFYFEETLIEVDVNGHVTVEGYILCRLPPDSRALQKLALRLYQSAWLLGIPHGQYARLSRKSHPDVYRNIITPGNMDPFQLPIAFRLLGRSARARIYLSLTGTSADSVLISGFPRRMGESLAIPTTYRRPVVQNNGYR